MSKKEESKFCEKVDKDLKKYFGKDIFIENIQQAAKCGTPDRVICIRGKFVALELKTNTGVVSKIQELKMYKIISSGGISFVVNPNNWQFIFNELKKI